MVAIRQATSGRIPRISVQHDVDCDGGTLAAVGSCLSCDIRVHPYISSLGPARVTSQSGPRTGAASPADQPLTLPRSTRAQPPIPAVRIVRVRDPLPLV